LSANSTYCQQMHSLFRRTASRCTLYSTYSLFRRTASRCTLYSTYSLFEVLPADALSIQTYCQQMHSLFDVLSIRRTASRCTLYSDVLPADALYSDSIKALLRVY
jgi:hypothetical protein